MDRIWLFKILISIKWPCQDIRLPDIWYTFGYQLYPILSVTRPDTKFEIRPDIRSIPKRSHKIFTCAFQCDGPHNVDPYPAYLVIINSQSGSFTGLWRFNRSGLILDPEPIRSTLATLFHESHEKVRLVIKKSSANDNKRSVWQIRIHPVLFFWFPDDFIRSPYPFFWIPAFFFNPRINF